MVIFAVLERSRLKQWARRVTRSMRLPGVPVVRPTIVRMLSHDASAHTQGLACTGGTLYESTGLRDASSLRQLSMATGEAERVVPVTDAWAEGIAVLAGRLVQLTYTEGRAIVYRLPELAAIDSHRYAGQGWGLAASETGYVMSDGSDMLQIRDAGFNPTGSLQVTIAGRPLRGLNDLECANGRIYANVLMHTDVYEISATTGAVIRIVDCTEVLRRSGRRDFKHVLNGIAFCAERGTFWVTGKHWPTLFELAW